MRPVERFSLLCIRAFHTGRVEQAPVHTHEIAKHTRARLGGRAVAHGDNQIHASGIRFGKFVPGLAAQAFHRETLALQLGNGERIDPTGWLPALKD